MKYLIFANVLNMIIAINSFANSGEEMKPMKLGIIGLSHSHVHWALGRPDLGDLEIVGIVEPNRDLAERYSEQYGFSMDLVFGEMDRMLTEKAPEAVAAFGSIREHLEVVEKCSPKGIHVMVEKPLAVSLEHARKMRALAKKHNIHLLTNYETTWYPTNHMLYNMVKKRDIGKMRKVIVCDGHKGPKEIGINKEFLDWLIDPAENGAGALTDFGCYGANLITWLKNGEKPVSVTAVLQNFKPGIYSEVDDEATIILEYNGMQGIIQASWNWPYSRKDMEVFGTSGHIFSINRNEIQYRFSGSEVIITEDLKERPHPYNDPFSYFLALIKNEIVPEVFSLSSIENNMIVMEILEAAKKSAELGKTVKLK